jgi:hypothetical protein
MEVAAERARRTCWGRSAVEVEVEVEVEVGTWRRYVLALSSRTRTWRRCWSWTSTAEEAPVSAVTVVPGLSSLIMGARNVAMVVPNCCCVVQLKRGSYPPLNT